MHNNSNNFRVSPPRVEQYTLRLTDSKSDSQISQSIRPLLKKSHSATGGLSSIPATRRRGSSENPNELKFIALRNSAERRKTPTNTPPSEPENESSSSEESSDDESSNDNKITLETVLNELLKNNDGSKSSQATSFCNTLNISICKSFKNKELAYTYLQGRINEFNIKKDYDSIVLIFRDEVSIKTIESSITTLINTTFSSNDFIIVFHPNNEIPVTHLERRFGLEFSKKEHYAFFDLKECVLSKINAITDGSTKVLIVANAEYEEQLQRELKKTNKKDYNPSKFDILSTAMNQGLLSVPQLSESTLLPIFNLILERLNFCRNTGKEAERSL